MLLSCPLACVLGVISLNESDIFAFMDDILKCQESHKCYSAEFWDLCWVWSHWMSLISLHLWKKSTTGKSKMNVSQLSFVLCARGDSIE